MVILRLDGAGRYGHYRSFMMRALALFVLLVVASGCESDFRLERVSPDTRVVGRVIGPDGDRLARGIPLDIAFVDARHGLMSTFGGLLLQTDDGGPFDEELDEH